MHKPIPLTWTDTAAIAVALDEHYPEAEPLALPLNDLRVWVAGLPGFQDAHVTGDDCLRAIQMLWYERAKAEEDDDVSG